MTPERIKPEERRESRATTWAKGYATGTLMAVIAWIIYTIISRL